MATLTDISANLGDMDIAGTIALDNAAAKPAIKADLVVNSISSTDMLAFTGFPAKLKVLPEAASDAQLQFPYLTSFNAAIKLAATKLELAGLPFENASLDITLGDDALVINSLKGGLWGGGVEVKATIGTGSIPTFAGSMATNSINLADTMRFIGGWENLTGKTNATMTLATSGIHYSNWLSGLEGNVAMSASEVTVAGFDLAALVSNATAVRTVADIQNVVKTNALKSETPFIQVQGNWPIQHGVVTANAVKLGNPATDATLGGTYSLLTRQIDMAAQFALKTLSPTTPPIPERRDER